MTEMLTIGTKITLDGQQATVTYWDANRSCHQRYAHITSCGSLGDHAHDECEQYEIRLTAGGHRRAWTCQLTQAEAEPRTPSTTDFPHVGSQLAWTAPDGRTTIVVQRTDHTYTVTVKIGTYRVDDHCGTYPTEQEARLIARGYAQMYRSEQAAPPVSQVEQPTPVVPGTPSHLGRPVARSHQLDMGHGQAEAIAYVMRTSTQHGQLAVLGRGRRDGCLTDPQLRALAKRGYVTLLYGPGPRKQIIGAKVLPAGVHRATEIKEEK